MASNFVISAHNNGNYNTTESIDYSNFQIYIPNNTSEQLINSNGINVSTNINTNYATSAHHNESDHTLNNCPIYNSSATSRSPLLTIVNTTTQTQHVLENDNSLQIPIANINVKKSYDIFLYKFASLSLFKKLASKSM